MIVTTIDRIVVIIQNVSALHRRSNLFGKDAATTERVPATEAKIPIQIPIPILEAGASGIEATMIIPMSMEKIPTQN